MTRSGQTVCLSMIVKDEAHVIVRCLASVRPIIDHWIIVDTGSCDGTPDVVRSALAGVPGEVVERPWVDFAHNRSEALALARPHADYSLVIDADDELVLSPGFEMPLLSAASYLVTILDVGSVYARPQIVRNDLPWRYEGVLHEYLTVEGHHESGTVPGLSMRRNHDGARRRDAHTYRRDADLLERALATEQSPFLVARYTFYLAQSYRDCGEPDKALDAYLRRAELGFWIDEVFVALLNAARLREQLDHGADDVLSTYRRASEALPTRAEAFHGAARYCLKLGRHDMARTLAVRGLAISKPNDGLFVEPWIYEYGLLDELSVAAYWSGRYEQALLAADRLLREPFLPADMRDRVGANRQFAADKMPLRGPAPRDACSALRLAVVTPYYKEEPAVLERCLASVRSQTVPTDHIVVADGFPQSLETSDRLRHIVIDRGHGDYGGTPRAIGAMLAVSEGYDVVAFLDADNWFDADHMEQCLATAMTAPDGVCDYVTATLRTVRPDGTVMNIWPEDPDTHVDTSCFVFFRGAFHLLPVWALMPKAVAVVGDRTFYDALRHAGLKGRAASKTTVNYTSLWASHYAALGEPSPPGAKPNVGGDVAGWIAGLSDRDRIIAERLMQVPLRQQDAPPPPMPTSVAVVSFYMDNVDDEVRAAQRAVVDRFLPPAFDFQQIRTSRTHGAALTEFMAGTTADVVVFLDIDCVPTTPEALRTLAEIAAQGTLAGCVQRANHLDNNGHLYVGPFCMAVSKQLWIDLGRPGFDATERGDVGEELTYRCEASGRSTYMIWPAAADGDAWELRPGIRFGHLTQYGTSFLHAFGIRHPQNRRRFIERCAALVSRSARGDRDEVAPSPPKADAIAASDKDFWHRYSATYDEAFGRLGEVKTIVEFGVLNGDSVRWLARRFPEASIIAADIMPIQQSWPRDERIRYVQIDQGDRSAVRAFFGSLGAKLDLIIEDGSHEPPHQVTCLVEGVPHLRSGKLYILEDIHTSHPLNRAFSSATSTGPNALHVLLAIEQRRAIGAKLSEDLARTLASAAYLTSREVQDLDARASRVEIFKRAQLPMRCYRCGAIEFDFVSLTCACGVDLYDPADSMSALIWT